MLHCCKLPAAQLQISKTETRTHDRGVKRGPNREWNLLPPVADHVTEHPMRAGTRVSKVPSAIRSRSTCGRVKGEPRLRYLRHSSLQSQDHLQPWGDDETARSTNRAEVLRGLGRRNLVRSSSR